jgi:hypothetical protein
LHPHSYAAASQSLDSRAAPQAPAASQSLPGFDGYSQFGGAPAPQQPAHQQPFGGAAYLQHYQQAQMANGHLHAASPVGQRSDASPFPGQPGAAPQHQPSPSAYASLSDTQQSAYYQSHGSAPTSQAPGQQQAAPSSYAAFHSVQQPQQAQAGQYSQADYSHLYGMQRPDAVPSPVRDVCAFSCR